MFRDFRTKTQHFKILFVGRRRTGLEQTVLALAASLDAGRVTPGNRTALADLELAAISASSDEVNQLRHESLGFEIVRRGRAADGHGVAAHLFWLPLELVEGSVQIGRMTLDWLRGADRVVVLEPEGVAVVSRWYAAHEPAVTVTSARPVVAELASIVDEVAGTGPHPSTRN